MSTTEIINNMEQDDMFELETKEEITERKQQQIEWSNQWEDNEKESFFNEVKAIIEQPPQ